jgi:hypothetical protein
MSDDVTNTHWRLAFPTDYLAAADFRGRDVTLQIKSVALEDLPLAGTSKTERRPVVTFAKTPKKLVLNKTNSKTIAKLLGPYMSKWAGKQITLYPTTTEFGRETVECIRVRGKLPAQKQEAGEVEADEVTTEYHGEVEQ